MNERLKQQLDFILEIDKEKNILRQTHLSGHGRRENDAEHAWHMAIMAYLLKDYANEPVDIAKVMIMCLIHDIVEIDAGDTYAYDTEGLKTQKAREDAAKERIFSLLPEDQKKELEELQKTDEKTTNGVRNLRAYGTTGIRGEALAGYPSVTEIALPVLADGLYKEKEWNRIKLQILFALMSRVQDSNILARKNPAVLYEVQVQSMKFLNEGGAYSEHALEKLYLMDAEYTSKNISAGGCADLLAVSVFLAMICKKIPQ